ncbi:hypothetical protein SAMN05892883_4244 [Jatrophihabitans sp. GAS493]|uniref:hypothetical protein n=1 Tax=Jatrophihabitans sp. GAS493 TaxID=1907575 RepID=UPI000BB9439F|nr:hypothetical protein [Jatrophihabitans sp. GAS493]SOD75043.1 hypothetical protein SAMN05892883_4244 [Jatrophihabitans sp. GAS493]
MSFRPLTGKTIIFSTLVGAILLGSVGASMAASEAHKGGTAAPERADVHLSRSSAAATPADDATAIKEYSARAAVMSKRLGWRRSRLAVLV